jgi:hypothetical protein
VHVAITPRQSLRMLFAFCFRLPVIRLSRLCSAFARCDFPGLAMSQSTEKFETVTPKPNGGVVRVPAASSMKVGKQARDHEEPVSRQAEAATRGHFIRKSISGPLFDEQSQQPWRTLSRGPGRFGDLRASEPDNLLRDKYIVGTGRFRQQLRYTRGLPTAKRRETLLSLSMPRTPLICRAHW